MLFVNVFVAPLNVFNADNETLKKKQVQEYIVAGAVCSIGWEI
jgi:hypothetical protein